MRGVGYWVLSAGEEQASTQHPVTVQRSAFRLLSSLPDNLSTSFPQELWKSLWISRLFALQVSENFRLLAFCTLARQTITDLSQRAARAPETETPPKKRRLYHPVLRRRRGHLLL